MYDFFYNSFVSSILTDEEIEKEYKKYKEIEKLNKSDFVENKNDNYVYFPKMGRFINL